MRVPVSAAVFPHLVDAWGNNHVQSCVQLGVNFLCTVGRLRHVDVVKAHGLCCRRRGEINAGAVGFCSRHDQIVGTLCNDVSLYGAVSAYTRSCAVRQGCQMMRGLVRSLPHTSAYVYWRKGADGNLERGTTAAAEVKHLATCSIAVGGVGVVFKWIWTQYSKCV